MVEVLTSDMARLVTVLSLPWMGKGQRGGEEKEERTRERGETTGGEGGVWHLRHFPCLISCIIAAFRFRRNARAKRHMCEADIQGVSKLYRERTCPRNVGGGISQRYETSRKESPRAIHKYGNERKKKILYFHYKEYHVAIDSPGPTFLPAFLDQSKDAYKS